MNNLFLCQLLLLVARASGAAHLATTTTAGTVVTLDWAKCCDCEKANGLVKTEGKACEVEITTAHSLRIKYNGSSWWHNIIEVPTQMDYNSCTIPTTKNATGQTAAANGVKAMDETMTYSKTGTFYYACSMMCLASTGGTTPVMKANCHCKKYNHKLKVTVTKAGTTTAAGASSKTASSAQMSSPMAILTSSVVCLMAAFGSWF